MDVSRTAFRKKKQRVFRIVRILKTVCPDASIALQYSTPWELLVAVILSAQCTDKKVNEMTRALFQKYRTIQDYAAARTRDFEKDIYSTGFYKNKAKHILSAARMILATYGGRVPDTMNELLGIPGIGRKTANVLLGTMFGKAEGIVVDTHVMRLSKKLGLTSAARPDTIERDLMALVPRHKWIAFSHMLIQYGRTYCPAKKHDHSRCPLARI